MIDLKRFFIPNTKPKTVPVYNTTPQPAPTFSFDKTLVKKAVTEFYESTKRKSISLDIGRPLDKEDPKRLLDTKIGGNPYWPNTIPYPINTKTNEPLMLAAQLNFSKLPKLPNFPTSGILQFFIDGLDDLYGAQSKNNCGFKAVYHSSVNVSKQILNIPFSSFNSEYEEYLPITGVYYPIAKIEDCYINSSLEYYDHILIQVLNKYLGTSYKYYTDIPSEIRDFICDEEKDMGYYKSSYGCRIGGYPYFIQYDDSDPDDQLLLQLEDDCFINGNGVAKFLLPLNKLKAKKFNDTHYTWDCD